MKKWRRSAATCRGAATKRGSTGPLSACNGLLGSPRQALVSSRSRGKHDRGPRRSVLAPGGISNQRWRGLARDKSRCEGEPAWVDAAGFTAGRYLGEILWRWRGRADEAPHFRGMQCPARRVATSGEGPPWQDVIEYHESRERNLLSNSDTKSRRSAALPHPHLRSAQSREKS